ncbi:sensor histidine kinase [Pimelobacter simplex]|uniref:sensor histidine kinase n=1 Tax=Nocardioides simplex TaxID=2045 RepID=UPI00214FB152|nr:histidine kinase [Pimelobacter simplex]UUW89644.1 histidine kinase [Pimelobacter simplex]UUW93473.1 histidine kinase [Pimelobacter simplex]
MFGQARAGDGAGDGVALAARRRTRLVVVATCTVVGVLAALVAIGEAVGRTDPPADDLVALWLLAEVSAIVVSVPLLLRLLGYGSVPAGLALAALAPLTAATPAAVVALVLVVSLRSRRTTVLAVLAFVVPAALAVVVLQPGQAPGLLALLAGVVVVLVLTGTVTGARRELRVRARREQALVAERARSEERARIAGEMHDSLSHHLSLIALHAGALGRRADLPPETVRSSSRLVADLSRTAHAELRDVLGVLHQGPQPTTPPTGAEGLRHLVAQHRAAGAVIEAELDPAVAARAGEATSRLLHRVVRELLANAARHAPGAPVRLLVAGHADGVDVVCRNPVVVGRSTAAAGAGLGLQGVAERVRLAGGRHRAEACGGEFVVEVSVPW